MKKILLILFTWFISIMSFASTPNNIQIGDNIQNIQFTTIDGEVKTGKDFLGKKLLISFTATWCPDCIEEKIKMHQKYDELINNNNNMEVILIFGDFGSPEKRDNLEKVNNYLSSNNYTFQSYFDKNRVLISMFNIKSIPTSILVDENGTVIERAGNFYNLKLINLLPMEEDQILETKDIKDKTSE